MIRSNNILVEVIQVMIRSNNVGCTIQIYDKT